MSVDNIFESYQMKLEKNFAQAVFDLHEAMSDRIFKDNKDINGNKPKPYSTKPMYASKATYSNFKLGGEETRGGKSKYFENGYSQLKRESDRPPIELFGRLRESFDEGLTQVNAYEYEIVIPIEDGDKIRGHFVNFFKVSEKENQNLLKEIIGDSESN